MQAGQSGQPRPDWLSRTAAPVRMISAEVITPASAQRRRTVCDGASSMSAQRAHRAHRASAVALAAGMSGAASGAGTHLW